MNYIPSEGLARALFEESGDALFLLDPETERICDVNSMSQRLTGFPLHELLGMALGELFRCQLDVSLERLREATHRTGLFHSQEGYFLRTVRANVWIPVNLTLSRLHVKPATLALITARDLRERWDAQSQLQAAQDGLSDLRKELRRAKLREDLLSARCAQLQEAEAGLRQALAALPDCLWSADLDDADRLVNVSFSAAVEKIVGRPPANFQPGIECWWDIIHPDDQPRWAAALARLRAGRPSQEEYRVLRPDGGYRWVRDSVQVTPRGEGRRHAHLDGIISDITGRDRVVERLGFPSARLLSFLDGSPVLALMKDPDGRLIYCNAPFAGFFGKEGAELLGKQDDDLFPPAVASRLREADAAVLATLKPSETLEEVPTPDGDWRCWLVHKFPVEDAAGQKLLGGMVVDVTAWKRAGKLAAVDG